MKCAINKYLKLKKLLYYWIVVIVDHSKKKKLFIINNKVFKNIYASGIFPKKYRISNYLFKC